MAQRKGIGWLEQTKSGVLCTGWHSIQFMLAFYNGARDGYEFE
jgi:hypothetical protein